MQPLPFANLRPHKTRRFLPPDLTLDKWDTIAPFFDRLESAANAATSPSALEQWLLTWSELNAALDEEGSRRYIAMTCHTDNVDAEKAYLDFVENIEPQIKPRQFRLNQIYLAHPHRPALPRPRYLVFDRDVENQVKLYRDENVPLETEDAKLGQQYQKLTGSLTVQFRGEEKTLVQMSRYQEETDRALRQEAWELVAKRRLQEAGNFDDIFDKLITLRGQIAANAGFANYRDYAFLRMGRFDYTPQDCEAFHTAVEKHIMPLLRELNAERRAQLKLPALRPWDLAVDPLNRPPLRPFETSDRLVSSAQRIFNQLDPQLGADFQLMQDKRLLDLDNRKGKAPGGYQCNLSESRLPFIFMNAVGIQRDVETLLHEAGHAFHALATKDEDFYAYRSAPIEFAEVASMSMELLGNEHLEEYYSPADANRARRNHLEGIIGIFAWIAAVDAFQHWIYTHPGHTRAQRSQAWLALMERFSGDVDWSGYEAARANMWHRQLHIFLNPFYYIEYGIAQLGALQVWANARNNKPAALRAYRDGLALGGSRPLPELFKVAGCQFAFDAGTIAPLVDALRHDLKQLKS
jgi:oligoendopeptidase F